jgi:hypothetical protein
VVRAMGTCLGVVVGLLLWAGNAMAGAPQSVIGPVYPLPGYNDAAHQTHGGDSCGQAGTGLGAGAVTWYFGGDPSTSGPSAGGSCATTGTTPAFDTTRFQAAYWGLNLVTGTNQVSASSSGHQGYCGVNTSSGPMTFDATDSTPASGILVYQGTNDSADKLTMTFKDSHGNAVALTNAATLSFASSGVNAAKLGYVVAITPQLTNFNVTMNYTVDGFGLGNLQCATTSDVTGAFYYVDRPPTGDFTYSTPANHEPVNLTVGTLSDPDGTVSSYSWDLTGSGTYGTDANTPNPSTADLGPGTHTVGLQIVDNQGTVTDVTHTFTITNQAPTGSIGMSPDPAQNHTTETFSAQNVTDPDQGTCANPTYTWDLTGQGNFNSATDPYANQNATKSFGPGTYTVDLQITDCDGASTVVSKTFTITPGSGDPTGSISITNGTDPPGNHTLTTFHATVSDPDQGTDGTCAAPTYVWDLTGQNNFSPGQDPNQDATTSFGPGQYTVDLQITDCDGNTTVVTKTFTITNQAPTGSIGMSPDPAENHTTETFSAQNVTDPDQGNDGTCANPTYTWDLTGQGNFNSATDPNANQNATKSFGPGTYTVDLQITDCDGTSTVVSKTFTITPGSGDPTGSISITNGTDPPGNHTPTTFHATVSDPDQGTDGTCAAPTYVWDLTGQNNFSPGQDANQDATQSFGPGQHTLDLQITDCDGNTTVVTKTFTITNQAPTGTITVQSPGTDPPGNHTTTTFVISNLTDPDQGNDGTCASPTVAWDLTGGTNYSSASGANVGSFGPGQHTVAALLTDCDGGTTVVTKTFTITNKAPVAAYSCVPAAPMAHQTTLCTSSSHDPDAAPGDALTQKWTLGNTTPQFGKTCTFSEPAGTYSVTLSVTDRDGATTPVTHKLTVKKATATVAMVSGQRLAGALAQGIKAKFTADDATSAPLSLTVTKATSKAGKPMKITGIMGSAKPSLTKAGTVAFTIKLTSTAKQKLSPAKTVTFALAGSAKDKFGNVVPIHVSITLS